jgi:hypothetical protein
VHASVSLYGAKVWKHELLNWKCLWLGYFSHTVVPILTSNTVT